MRGREGGGGEKCACARERENMFSVRERERERERESAGRRFDQYHHVQSTLTGLGDSVVHRLST